MAPRMAAVLQDQVSAPRGAIRHEPSERRRCEISESAIWLSMHLGNPEQRAGLSPGLIQADQVQVGTRLFPPNESHCD
jgi:hypothetical protein